MREEYRVASKSTNAPSALDHGEEVTDALLDWIEEGLPDRRIPADRITPVFTYADIDNFVVQRERRLQVFERRAHLIEAHVLFALFRMV